MSKKNVLKIADDNSDYYGKYIAKKDFSSKEVIAFDKDLLRARKKARKKGFNDPVITYFPYPHEICIHSAA